MEPAIAAIEVGDTSGAGFVISRDGLILTAAHGVTSSYRTGSRPRKHIIAQIGADGPAENATVVGVDLNADVALLKVANGTSGVRPLMIAQGASPPPGTPVHVFGAPYLVDARPHVRRTMVSGAVSGPPSAQYGNYDQFATGSLQHDVDAAPGYSGAPVVDAAGQVVGVELQALGEKPYICAYGHGATSAPQIRRVLRYLRNGQQVPYATLNIRTRSVDRTVGTKLHLMARMGALVMRVGGAGRAAGLRRRDVIVKLNSKTIENTSALLLFLAHSSPGDVVDLVVERHHRQRRVRATLATKPGNEPFVMFD